jgi:ribonuclease P protein component
LKYTLNSTDKLRLKSEFNHVRVKGHKLVGRYCLLVTAPDTDGKLRCGVICGKKYSNRAVKRNRARRLMWESFRLLKPQISTCHMVLIARKMIADAKQMDVQAELERLLKKAGQFNPLNSPSASKD